MIKLNDDWCKKTYNSCCDVVEDCKPKHRFKVSLNKCKIVKNTTYVHHVDVDVTHFVDETVHCKHAIKKNTSRGVEKYEKCCNKIPDKIDNYKFIDKCRNYPSKQENDGKFMLS